MEYVKIEHWCHGDSGRIDSSKLRDVEMKRFYHCFKLPHTFIRQLYTAMEEELKNDGFFFGQRSESQTKGALENWTCFESGFNYGKIPAHLEVAAEGSENEANWSLRLSFLVGDKSAYDYVYGYMTEKYLSSFQTAMTKVEALSDSSRELVAFANVGVDEAEPSMSIRLVEDKIVGSGRLRAEISYINVSKDSAEFEASEAVKKVLGRRWSKLRGGSYRDNVRDETYQPYFLWSHGDTANWAIVTDIGKEYGRGSHSIEVDIGDSRLAKTTVKDLKRILVSTLGKKRFTDPHDESRINARWFTSGDSLDLKDIFAFG